MQKIPRRFDNKLDNKLNAKLNYGKKFNSNASAYLQDFRRVPVQRDQLDDAKRCQSKQKVDHCTESKPFSFFMNVYSFERKSQW